MQRMRGSQPNLVPSCTCACCISASLTTQSSMGGGRKKKCVPPPEQSGRRCSERCRTYDSILATADTDKWTNQRIVHYERYCFYECAPRSCKDGLAMESCNALTAIAVQSAITLDGNGKEIDTGC